MAIKITKFVWINEPKPKPEEKIKATPKALPEEAKVDEEYIRLTKDGTLRLKRSPYIDDMVGKDNK